MLDCYPLELWFIANYCLDPFIKSVLHQAEILFIDTTLAYNISCSHEGFGLKVTDTRSIYSQLSPYFSYISQNTSQTILLNPYGDEELILTAVKSVYSQCWGTNRLIGVIGVDFSLADVQLVLSRARSENSYAFIINQFGEVNLISDTL